jgi:hypothetical protein
MASDRKVEIMAKVLFSPQVNQGNKIGYSFQGDVLTITLEGITDIFDFTDMPIGIMDSVETDLPMNPILRAERKADGLYLTLLNYINEDATQEECFPDWIEV